MALLQYESVIRQGDCIISLKCMLFQFLPEMSKKIPSFTDFKR